MGEREESDMRSQAILMIARNYQKPYVIRRVLKRFKKCISGG
jgi:hypothetical protein